MLSKSQLKLINSLHQKKYRNKYGLFIAEGVKVVNELLNSALQAASIYHTDDYFPSVKCDKSTIISKKELSKISSLKTPNKVVGLFKIPKEKSIESNGLIVVLDGINDPGNLGTIIRLCDWFGVKQLVCSENTVDCYNSKVVQSTMGSLARVNILYTDLHQFLTHVELPIYGAVMNGKRVYNSNLPVEGILVMGNEANGISQQIEAHINHRITIPRHGDIQQTESLNVATATGILLNEFRRN